jgi:hypothetical protein
MSPALLIFLIPITIMTLLFRWAFRMRRRYRGALHGPLSQPLGNLQIGSAPAIRDAGQVPWRDLLDALAVQPEGPYHEGWMGTMLGLSTKWSTSTTILEPHRMWGEREGRSVEIRLGPNEKIEGNRTMFSNKNIQAITRVATPMPEFVLDGDGGALRTTSVLPGAVNSVLVSIGPSEVWHELRIVAGPAGIEARRPIVGDALNSWLYDLWLCERIARALSTRQPTAPSITTPSR